MIPTLYMETFGRYDHSMFHEFLSHNSCTSRAPQVKILVDKYGTARIGGLGNAFILSNLTPLSPRDGTRAGGLPHDSASKPISPQPEGVPDHSLRTKADDVFGFGIVAWEVWTVSVI